jgi:hypothetical protein
MTTQDAIEAIVEWLRDVNPELLFGYAYPPVQKNTLPDVVVECDRSLLELGDTDFPLYDIQQHLIRRWDLTISFMVENTDPGAAASLLRTFEDRVTTQVLSDSTLGRRVPFISPFVTFDYTPPFVEYADGTRGREMTLSLSVGELVEADQ